MNRVESTPEQLELAGATVPAAPEDTPVAPSPEPDFPMYLQAASKSGKQITYVPQETAIKGVVGAALFALVVGAGVSYMWCSNY